MRALLSAAVFAAAIGFADDAAKPDVKTKLKELQDGLQKANKDLGAEFKKAETPEEKKKISDKFTELRTETGKKAFELGRDWPKDDAAIDALKMAIQLGSQKVKTDTVDLLKKDFIDNPKLVLALGSMSPKDKDEISEKTKSKDVKGTIKHQKLEQEMEALDYPRGKGKTDPKEAAEKFTKLTDQLNGIAKEYGDVKTYGWDGKENGTLAKSIEKNLYFMNNLTIGKSLPDVDCEDLDGKKVKISDYRGKVVVLDIWATWCGPCRQMIPHERELVDKLKEKPFVFVSVSADDQKKELTDFLEKEKMPWTHWWAGSKGKLLQEYQVQFYPTIYVIDCKGVIRHKHVRGEEMDKAVESLLKEMETGGQ